MLDDDVVVVYTRSIFSDKRKSQRVHITMHTIFFRWHLFLFFFIFVQRKKRIKRNNPHTSFHLNLIHLILQIILNCWLLLNMPWNIYITTGWDTFMRRAYASILECCDLLLPHNNHKNYFQSEFRNENENSYHSLYSL